MAEEAKTEEREFFAVYDGTKGRPSNTNYLDVQERVEAEKTRARLEEREPKLDDLGALPPAVGTQMVVKEMQVDNSTFANPSVGSGFTEPREVDPLAKGEVETEAPRPDVDLSLAAQYARERQGETSALSEVSSEHGGSKDSLSTTTDASTKSTPDATKRTSVK